MKPFIMNLSGMDFFSFYTSYLGPVPALLAGIYAFHHLRGGLKWIFWFTVFGTLSQWASKLVVLLGYYNIGMLHFYVPIEFFLLSMAYVRLLEGFIQKRILYAVMTVFLLFCLIYSLIVFDFNTYHSFVRAISGILLSCYAILLYMKMLNDLKIVSLRREPLVWINTSIFLYFSGSFFVFMTFNAFLNQSWALSKSAFRINVFLGSVFYILIAAGFLIAVKNNRGRKLTVSNYG